MKNLFNLMQNKRLLPRKRIDALYQSALSYHIISVIAGAGYGKTQSVLSYVSKLDAQIIWIPLSNLDNYTVHFWESFCNVLSYVDPDFSQKNQDIGFPEDPLNLSHFFRHFKDFIQQSKPVFLVFDDCHLIKAEPVCHFIRTLLAAELSGTTIFLLSRPNSMLNQAEALQGHPATLIDENALAFTPEEIEEYFRYMDLTLPASLINSVWKKSEGWPIAVYLLVLYTKENPSKTIMSPRFTNTNLFDIIEREIFSVYNSEEKKFLLKLSLLNPIPVRLMKEIYGDKGLEQITENLLFRYNEHSHAFHIHQLMNEFLQLHMHLLDEGEIHETYRTAGDWFINSGQIINALHCYEQLNDHDKLWTTIWNTITSAKTPSKDLTIYLIELLDKHFKNYETEKPEFRLARAITYSQMAEYDKASVVLRKIVEQYYPYRSSPDIGQLLGESLLSIALLHMLRGNTEFRQYFIRARKYLPEGSRTYTKGMMLLLNGDAITLRNGAAGELDNWVDTLKENETDADLLLHNIMHGMADLAESQGRYYQGDMAKAEQAALNALHKGSETQSVDIVGYAYYLLIKLSLCRGQYDNIQMYISKSQDYMKQYNTNPSYNLPEIAEGFFYLQIGQEHLLSHWITDDSTYGERLFSSNYGLERILKAHYLLKQRRYSAMLSLLDQTKEIYIKSNRFIGLVYIHLLYCFAYHQTGESEQAVRAFEKVYELVHPNNLIMPIVEMGKLTRTITPFIAEHSKVIPESWLHMVRTKSSTYRKRMQLVKSEYLSRNHISDSRFELTNREKQLLTYIAQGLSREEIAAEMYISLNTIKSTLKVIYTKLDAENSSHAVYVAMKNNLLD